MPEWLGYNNFERGLSPAIIILNKVSNALNLPEHVNNYSLRLYEIILSKKITSGRKREPLMGACVYISCLGTNYPVNLNLLCKVLECDKKELIRQKKFIKRFVVTNEQGITVDSYINRYGYQLRLKPTEITHAINLSKMVEQELANKTTQVKAATCLYLVARNKVSIRGMARATGLSISAIHSSIKKLKDKKPFIDLLICDKPILFLEKKKRK